MSRAKVTFHQYRDIFQFLAHAVSDLARLSVLSHDRALHTILERDPRHTERRGMGFDSLAEVVLRDVLVSALGLQNLDHYVSTTAHQILTHAQKVESGKLHRMVNYDPSRLVSWIHEPGDGQDEQITLGSKALGLKQLAEWGHRVPDGFVLTTELFGALPAMSYEPLEEDSVVRIRNAIQRLEESSDLRIGDPERLLTLSIRSGAAISMPGLMVTFTNVGLNDELTEAWAQREGFHWTAWDSYRRFVQTWAMSSGVERDLFDDIIRGFKEQCGIKRKLEFTGPQMRKIALTYRRRAEELGVVFEDDPSRQIIQCIRKVLESWNASQACFYRRYLGVAEDWGTSVIIQRMVLGNQSRASGSGVTFTRNPHEPHSRRVCLYGDFAVCSQGEDLVGGLVNPLPISEAQRHGSVSYRGVEHSLERDFPEIYARLLELGEFLAEQDGDPQEIEFTFESEAASDLYLLQKRPMVQGFNEQLPTFDMRAPAEQPAPIAFGVGVAGGAYAGRVAINEGQIDKLRAETPDATIILLRPDTVPEDLAMIVRVDGILTARGGATSHAAVTAKRLGKTAVVDCRTLEVLERAGIARLAGRELRPGDWLSVDGRTGGIFLGKLDTIQPPPRKRT
jgi:pyruvate,orthophosphate dikinase